MPEHIEIQDIKKVFEAGARAARNLGRAARANENDFQAAAWDLARAVAPAGSNPLGMLLSPAARNRTDGLGVLWLPFKRMDDEVGLDYAVSGLNGQIEQASKKLKGMLADQLRSYTVGMVEPETPERHWHWRYLTQLKYPGEPRAEWINEKWVRLAAFTAFHMGDAARFSADVLHHRGNLTSYWRAFLHWHAGHRDGETVRLLKSVVTSREHSAGKRKASLLLLLWDAAPKDFSDRLSFLRQNISLLRRNIAYKGSPPLPVNKMASLRPAKEILDEIEKLIQSSSSPATNETMKRLQNLTTELLGARAMMEPIRECLARLTIPNLRAIVIGGNETERVRLQHLLAAITGRIRAEWEEWTPIVARQRVRELELELGAYSEKKQPGILLGRLSNRTLLANDLERWDNAMLDGLVDLLPDELSERSWLSAIITTRSDALWTAAQKAHYRSLYHRLTHVIELNEILVRPPNDRPDWLDLYERMPIRDIAQLRGIVKSTAEENVKKEFLNGHQIALVHKGKWYALKKWLEEKRKSVVVQDS